MKRILPFALALTAMPLTAQADLGGFHVAARADYFTGSGDLFTRFNSDFAYGLELGFEIIGVEIWGEAMMMGSDQYFFSANMGFGWQPTFKEHLSLDLGIYTGPMFFLFPPDKYEKFTMPHELASDMQAAGFDPTSFENAYNTAMQEADDLGRVAVGWNLGRARLAIAYSFVPEFALGIEGTAAYHYILSGEDIIAGAKNQSLNKIAKEHPNLPKPIVDRLRNVVGAKEVDDQNLSGFNFSGGVFLRYRY